MGAGKSTPKIPKELSVDELEKIRSKTNLPIYEISKWYSQFYEFSSGHQLNEHFFVKYYKQLVPYKGKAEDFCHLIFKAFDVNDSDLIDFSEMIVGMTILAQGQPKERLAWIFRIYDQNGDGYIDMNELNVTIHAILAMTDENFDKNKDNLNEIITKIANSLAKNDPEKINSNEFVEGILSHPFLMDLMCPKNI